MLVAVTSLVLHGAAVAGLHQHLAGSIQCAAAASTEHSHTPSIAHAASKHSHKTGHHGGASHHHAEIDLTDSGAPADQQASGGAGDQCCASICAVALVASGPDTLSVPVSVAQAPVPDSQVGSGIDPSGVKRPPRTPCIA
jgi:hypothetical protein